MYPYLNIPYNSHSFNNYSQTSMKSTQPTEYKQQKRFQPFNKTIKPPQLALSTQIIYRYRTFTLTLTVSEEWRLMHRLRPEDLIKSVMSATCHKESTVENQLNEEVKSCKLCQSDRRIIEIDHCDQNQIGPVTNSERIEKYTFNKCKSFCSSSRNHHHSRLCLVIDGLPEGPYYSAPFVLQAREKRTGNKTENDDKEEKEMKEEENEMPIVNEDTHIDLNDDVIVKEEIDEKEYVMTVILYIANMEMIKDIVTHYCNEIRKINGVINVKQTIQNEVCYINVFFDSAETFGLLKKLTESYIINQDTCQNGVNSNLIDMGIVSKYFIIHSDLTTPQE